jgi:ABC-2 type transport system ATP-binding protein
METVIVVEDLWKRFRTPFRRRLVEAVRGVSFSVERGEVFGFLGPNGAGKTTTIKVMTGLVRASGGRVSILGSVPDDIRVRERMGFLPEQPYFYDYLTASEIMDTFGRLCGLSGKERTARSDALLARVGLWEARSRRLRKFSKGMLQRLGLAQALLNDPDVVILDEPMSGLDPIGRHEVRDLILELKAKGKTVFFSSHILSDVEALCDRVVVLNRGEVKARGRLSELLTSGAKEVEIVVGAVDSRGVASGLPEGVLVAEAGGGCQRIICPVAVRETVLQVLLQGGFSVLSVNERKASLEELVMGVFAGQ